MQVTIRSSYAVCASPRARKRLAAGKPVKRHVKPGTRLERFLRDMPELGPPGAWDDMMLHVFVNGKSRGLDYILAEGDTLDLHLPSSGG